MFSVKSAVSIVKKNTAFIIDFMCICIYLV